MEGLVGKKLGMTRLFTEDGVSIPVTVIEIKPNRVTQVKNIKTDGYCSVQVTTGSRHPNRVNRSILGHFLKSGVEIGRGLWEFRCKHNQSIVVGDILTVQFFLDIKQVDITGVSKGKGFAGTVKRWNFSTQDASHGNSLSHRAPGSIGQNQTPGKVFKGKKMAGQLGNCKTTIQNIDVMKIDAARDLLLVKGSIPGFIGSDIEVRKSVKCTTVSIEKK